MPPEKAAAARIGCPTLMRIVQMVDTLDRGGLEKMVIDISRAQKALGHWVSIYCLIRRGALADDAVKAGIPVYCFNKQPGFSPATFLRVARQLRADHAEAIHTHNPGVHHYGAVGAKLAGVRAVINTRHSPLDSKGRPYQERYFRWVAGWTNAVVSVSNHTRQALTQALGTVSSPVIPNGIPLDPFRHRQASPGSLRPGRIRFGTVGRLVPAKAHSVLIDAFAIVSRQLPSAELTIRGYGELEPALRRQVSELGLEAKVRIQAASGDEVPAVLANLDVFVLSSANEGLPLVILEALAAGLPIVSTRVGGVPEVAPESSVAWYCEPGRPEELAQAMLTAASSPDLAERGATARELAFSRYGVEHMTACYMTLLDGIRCASR
jgi:glycosyltransferase involved in cell wall biosynthesis